MVRWLRWHCPPDTGFEIRALAVWGRARYLSVTEAPHNTDFHTWMGKKHFCFFRAAETGNQTPDSGVKGSGANHYPRAPARLLYKFTFWQWSAISSPFAENRSAFFWINWLICSYPVSGNTWPRLAPKACSMRRIGHSLWSHLNSFRPKSIMPWPSCKASSPSTILQGRSPKTVTRIGFATPWILISVDPLTSKDAPKMPRNAGASASSLWRWERSASVWNMSSRRSVQEAPVSTNAPMDGPPTCKSTTGRPENAPTTSVRFQHSFGGTRGTCGPRGRTQSNEVFRQGSNQPRALAQYAGLFWSSLPECWPSRRSCSGP